MPAGATVVFSAHGVSPEVHRQAEERELKTIDATCPLVTKVHHEAKRFAGDDYDILLIGHAGHEEVEGTAGEAPEHIQLVESPADVPNIVVRDPAKVAWLSQTTLSVDETLETVAAIRERFPLLLDPPSDDICYATQNRQLAVKEISRDCRPADRGGLRQLAPTRSGWSRSRSRPAPRRPTASTTSSEIDEAWLDGVRTVSVTSGASVPGVAGRGGAGVPERARLPRRAGGAQRRGVADLRAAQGAAPRPQGRRPQLSCATAGAGCGAWPPRRARGRRRAGPALAPRPARGLVLDRGLLVGLRRLVRLVRLVRSRPCPRPRPRCRAPARPRRARSVGLVALVLPVVPVVLVSLVLGRRRRLVLVARRRAPASSSAVLARRPRAPRRARRPRRTPRTPPRRRWGSRPCRRARRPRARPRPRVVLGPRRRSSGRPRPRPRRRPRRPSGSSSRRSGLAA